MGPWAPAPGAPAGSGEREREKGEALVSDEQAQIQLVINSEPHSPVDRQS